MAAKTKTELLAVLQSEFGKLSRLIENLDAEVALRKNDEDTSIKDVIAHRAHWIDLYLGWYADGQAGKTVHFPAEGYKWNDLKRYNADLRIRQANLGWTDATMLLRAKYDELMNFIQNHSDQQLYDGPMKGASNAWPPGRWAEAAGPSHFRSASKFIRACLKEAA